ncbi:MAG: efflux RND transporter periplasmic adaptor subunit [Bacteroidia bacterium]|nr:efflux RND transporter periplasmic adaptor subunit [Bacteroidia bacterium]
MNKRTWLYIAGATLLIIILVTVKKCNSTDATEVAVEKAQRRSIVETVSANGKIQPEVEVKLSSEVSGEVVELKVKEGDHVKKGDLLVKINPNIYLSQLEAMQATVNSSKANLANSRARLMQAQSQFVNTEATYNRNKKLFDQGAISVSDFDASKAAYEAGKSDIQALTQSVSAAEFNVQNSEASLQEANSRLEKTNIFAPVSGTISKLSVEAGERVVGTSQMAGTELIRIANLNEMEASVDVNENDITRVHLNDTTLIQVDAVSYDRKFKGIVTEIANSANTTGISADQVTNFTVKIRVLQESYKDLMRGEDIRTSPFRPGMSASVDIQTKRVNNVITLPIEAVTTRSDSAIQHGVNKEDGGDDELEVHDDKETKLKAKEENQETTIQECVFLLHEGKAKYAKVTTGIQDNNYIEITEGIKEGDEVIAAPYSVVSKTLKNGKEVKVVDKTQLFSAKKKD